jgi:hypothetical protein
MLSGSRILKGDRSLSLDGGFRWAAELDGSKLTWSTFEFVTDLIRRRGARGERVDVLHVASPNQSELPAQLRAAQLEADVTLQGVRPLNHLLDIHFMSNTREDDVSTVDTLIDMANR